MFSNFRNHQGRTPGREHSHSRRCLRPVQTLGRARRQPFGVGRGVSLQLCWRGPRSAHLCPELRRGKWESASSRRSPGGQTPARFPRRSWARPLPPRGREGDGAPGPVRTPPPTPGNRARGALGAPVLSLQHFVEGSPWAACKPCPPSERRGKK